MTQPQPKKSDLGVRVASALVMVAVAGTALWLGGWVWTGFVVAVALGVLWEWWGLVRGFSRSSISTALWLAWGLVYIGIAAAVATWLRSDGMMSVVWVLSMVVATDVGAYFAGRTIGGPKIAPAISPSKTWSGFVGGAIGAGIASFAFLPSMCTDCPGSEWLLWWNGLHWPSPLEFILLLAAGALVAATAQSGDFFESWMKRRAGVKDSGKLIPGHGGLFDRADGLISVLFSVGLAIGIYFYAISAGFAASWSS